jgi:hypothetical protein
MTIDINQLTLGQLKEIQALLPSVQTNSTTEFKHPALNQYVIVRTYSAGVHFGLLKATYDAPQGMRVHLSEARRIYRWSGAFTLTEIANNGVSIDSKITETLNNVYIENAIEILPLADKAKINIYGIKNYVINE